MPEQSMTKNEKLGVFFGCTTAGAPHLLEGLEGFLKKAKIDYVPLGKDLCCGVPLTLAGYHKEAKDYVKKVANKLIATGITRLVTSCPHCYMMFRCEYPEEFGIKLPFEVLHFVEFADELLREGRIKLKNRKGVRIFYHDPCGIGRRGPGLYEEPRRVLKSCVQVIEADRNRVLGTCCGGGGLLRASLPKLAVAAATRKIRNDFLEKDADIIVTSCPFCTLNLAEGAAEITDKEINVFDLPQFLAENMEKVN
jgi:heterodisulfide reductase subunit D